MSSTARRSHLIAAGLLVGGTLLATGCQVTSPRQTDFMYDPAEGVSVDLGEVKVRNLVVVASSAEGAGVVSAAVSNETGEATTLTFSTQEGTPATVQLAAGASQSLSTEGSPVVLTPVGAPPGAVVTLQVGTPGAGTSPVQVPVLPATGYFESFTEPPR